MEPTPYDFTTGTGSELTGRMGCGENRYVDDENILQFWITTGCTLFIYGQNAIELAIRFDLDEKAFYDNCGIGKFAEIMTDELEIHNTNLKVI